MKKIIVLVVISLLVLSLTAFSVVSGSQPERVRVLIEFRGSPDLGLVHLAGGRVVHSYDIIGNVLAVEVPVTSLNGLLLNPNVVDVEFDVEVRALGPRSRKPPQNGGDGNLQPLQTLPWGVDRIDADLAVGKGAGITVCVVDTGIDKDHPDLQANLVGGRNFVSKGLVTDPTKWDDDNGHGTHVAGTVAAVDNTIGVVGVASRASLLAAKVLNRQGSGFLSDVIAGVDYCVTSGADVVSMSLGTSSDVQAFHNAVDAAYARGVLLVAAAGNSGDGDATTNNVVYPAKYSSVIAVSATAVDDSTPRWSSDGEEVELAAPGVSILSTWKDGSYNTISGTSMATPHVSGVAALAIEANPLLTNVEIRALLQNTADDLGPVGRDVFYGYGLVDAELK